MQATCMLLSFFVSLCLVNRGNIPSYMKGFYWYPLVGVISIFPAFITINFSYGFDELATAVHKISILFHFSFLGVFIIKALPGKKNTKSLNFLFAAFLSFLLLFLLTEDINEEHGHIFAFANFGLIIYCLIYYYHLFNRAPTFNLLVEPSFWIITGVFFTMSVHIPILLTIDYLHRKISIGNYRLLFCVTMLCYSVMHLFFIKAFLCSIRTQKV